MTTRADELGQFQIIYTIHQGFEYIGGDHVAHPRLWLSTATGPPCAPFSNSEGFVYRRLHNRLLTRRLKYA
ncbi:hypothetical protein AO262_24795 [Pseudomonas fluorescens ABAC62]|nr:hypothetical protein AO262_24795 [Pseudomonas fluorescens ABAC62]